MNPRKPPPRVYEVARLVAKGLSNKQIAALLDLSVKTVEKHLSRAYVWYMVPGRVALAEVIWSEQRP